jgi:hypothetical protein
MKYYPKSSSWSLVVDESDVIILAGCDFDGETLVAGSMHAQTDTLIGTEIVRKDEQFLKWAEKVFIFTKKQLVRSKALGAYVGRDTIAWEEAGGRFAALALPGREPLYVQRKAGGWGWANRL